ncbi:TerB N-terminal domain-containing protein [Burkholderia lata]|nr:TerB N-terminal domain-containing protein [Burkholderia lata]
MPPDHFFETDLNQDKPEVFPIRTAPRAFSAAGLTAHWVPAGMRVKVHHYSLPDGLVYLCGSAGRDGLAKAEPSLIDETLSIGREDNFLVRHLPLYPTYDNASPTARAAYLNWLSVGRRNPGADIGYVYLYFYGLERRATVDARTDPAARDEIPAICAEIDGLINTYRNASFTHRARALLDFCRYVYGDDQLTPPSLPLDGNSHAKEALLRLALSQVFHERHELPAEWLTAWYLNDSRFLKPPAAKRHREMFTAIFSDLCHRQFRINLATWAPPLSTKSLQLSYQPVSMALGAVHEALPLPDVTSDEAGLGRIVEAIAISAADELARYSRFVSRYSAPADAPIARLTLPCSRWPGPVWERLALILADLSAGVVMTEPTTLSELLAPLNADQVLERIPAAALIAQIETYLGVGVEPDPRHGAITPGASTPIVLFRSGDQPLPEAPREKSTDLLPLHTKHHTRCACVVFFADLIRFGTPNRSAALDATNAIIDRWEGLPGEAHVRLQALLVALTAPEAPAFRGKSALKKQTEQIDQSDKELLASELVEIARAGGAIEQVAMVRQLEKYFATLGADSKSLYDLAHASIGSNIPAPPGRSSANRGALDIERIAALRKETAAVNDVLTSIFADPTDDPVEHTPRPMAVETTKPPPEVAPNTAGSEVEFPALRTLDGRHSALLRDLIGRDTWAVADFAAACAAHGLMAAGALERINDAAFEAFDEPLLEGDDPIEFNPGPLAAIRN